MCNRHVIFNMSKPYSWFHHPPQTVQPKVFCFISGHYILSASKALSFLTKRPLSLSLSLIFHTSASANSSKHILNVTTSNCHHCHLGTSFHLLSCLITFYIASLISLTSAALEHIQSFLHKAAKYSFLSVNQTLWLLGSHSSMASLSGSQSPSPHHSHKALCDWSLYFCVPYREGHVCVCIRVWEVVRL